jgi:hypothetical protein
MAPKMDKKTVVAISATEADDVDLDELLNTLDLSPDKITSPSDSCASSTKEPRPILKRISSIPPNGEIAADGKSPNPPSENISPRYGAAQITQCPMDVSLSSVDSTRTRDSLSSSRRSLRRTASQVSFKTVEVREYDRTMGDNPSCMSGPPISLDWSYSKESEICIDEHEKVKNMRRRKNKNLIRLGKATRVNMLQNQLGYSEDEIKAATKEKKDIQRARSVTNLTSSFWRVEDVAQSATRKLKRALKKGHKSDGHFRTFDDSSSSFSCLDTSNSSLEPTLEI